LVSGQESWIGQIESPISHIGGGDRTMKQKFGMIFEWDEDEEQLWKYFEGYIDMVKEKGTLILKEFIELRKKWRKKNHD
jgi:hypothetical protein